MRRSRCVAAAWSLALAGVLLAGLPRDLFAQQRDTVVREDSARVQSLQSVRVSVTRDDARSPFELPFALTSAPLSARPAQRRTGVGDLLLGVPGVQVQDRANPSQDPRIAVRGFGARSAFGVRGVRVLRDGVPLSLPDGQTPVDWLDLETIDRVDIVRGTAAALYGNAAGGVIDMRSRAPARAPFGMDARFWDGGGLRRANVTLSGRVDDHEGAWRDPQWLGAFTRTSGNGPRAWSRLDATSAFVRGLATVKGTTLEVQGTRYEAPRAENTGALTAAELAHDPRLPDSLNITKQSRKAARQTQVAFIADRPFGDDGRNGGVRGALFAGTRTLDNPLPFAIVAVDRAVLGGSLHGNWRTEATPWPLRMGVGIDAQRQVDDRYNYENCVDLAPTAPLSARCPARVERGAVRLDQQERAGSVGSYARAEMEAPHGLFVSAALRADVVRFRVHDRFITATNADDSGERTLRAASPMVGLTWRARPLWSLYANLSSAFETPTVTELTNQEDGAAGLNVTLDPQRTRTVELGTQGVFAGRVRLEAAVFQATVRDELVPFDVPNQVGRRAYRNAGRTSRRGAETSVRFAGSRFDVGGAYTWSRFRFDRYDVGTVSYAGKPIPGVPEHYWQSFATARMAGLWSVIELTAASRASATDAATVYASGYAVWNLRAGYDVPTSARGGLTRLRLSPTLGVDNLFDRHYAGSLVVNATRNRYFEPGLPRRVTVTMQVRWE
ncbi:TonB-dependent receptor [Gemmatimonas aurantiaca]|uniref:TonB-dependent receptor family protein n=1 Tax=Gemmatimonas aurantiaca TaxID=173480 RepID=UPI00301D3E36